MGDEESRHLLGYLRIEQLSETGVIEHGLKVIVGAGLESIPGVHLNGAGEVVKAALSATGDGINDGQAVEGIVGVRVLIDDGAELLGGFLEVACVELGDGIVELLLGREEAEACALKLAAAGVDVHAAAFDDFRRCGGEELLEGSECLFVFALLDEGNGRLIVVEGRS